MLNQHSDTAFVLLQLRRRVELLSTTASDLMILFPVDHAEFWGTVGPLDFKALHKTSSGHHRIHSLQLLSTQWKHQIHGCTKQLAFPDFMPSQYLSLWNSFKHTLNPLENKLVEWISTLPFVQCARRSHSHGRMQPSPVSACCLIYNPNATTSVPVLPCSKISQVLSSEMDIFRNVFVCII